MPEGQPPLPNDVYLSERKSLTEAEQKSSELLDKNILTLAGGALGISLIFIEKIAPFPTAASIHWLAWAWVGLAVSLLSTLVSFLTSMHAYRRQRDLLDYQQQEKKVGKNCCAGATIILNMVSIVAFIFGIAALATFSVTNVNQIGTNDEQRQQGY